MKEHFQKVKNFLAEIGYSISHEDAEEGLVVISAEREGINQLVIDCEEDILVLEQFILELKMPNVDVLKRLLQINREIVHGALVLDEGGQRVIFRDTLQLENLDLNELEGSINALTLMLAEHADELIRFAE